MKKRAKSKAKTPKRSAKNSVPEQHELPDLVAVMMKVAERLEGLEKKMDWVISQIASRPSETRHPSPPVQHSGTFHHGQPLQPQNQGANPNQIPPQTRARSERVLYEAVCADCHKDCEVPFKPSGERPVYCKECFAKRKGGGNPQKPNMGVSGQQKQIKTITHEAGKETISENVTPSRHPVASTRKKQKSAKKSRKTR